MRAVERQASRAEFINEYTAYTSVPYSLISEELTGLYGTTVLQEMHDLIGYYNRYEKGVGFITEKYDDGFVPSDLRFKQARNLINRQARFMFAQQPDFRVNVPFDRSKKEQKKQMEGKQSIYQKLLDNVLRKNKIGMKLVSAAKDCFIGKRVAYVVNFSEDKKRISISFVPSIGFVYETDEDDLDVLSKLVVFYSLNDAQDKTEQRVYKKKYWMENGVCHIEEGVYDGSGNEIEEPVEIVTAFPYIIGGVILNDGLTGDLSGVSEMDQLEEFEAMYNKVANADIDAERKGMNPVTYAIDVDPDTTKELSRNPGSFWDLSSDQNVGEGDAGGGKVGVLESNMSYSTPLAATVDRIRASAFETAEVPDVSTKALQGIISSGKALRTVYWTLMVRCQEKFLTWEPALEHMLRIIIDGARLYPHIASTYLGKDKLPDAEYELEVVQNYPIQDDQSEEKQMDLDEVTAGVRSKKNYMQKWQGLSDDEVEEELQQMELERQTNESAYLFPQIDTKDKDVDDTSDGQKEEEQNDE